jgi:hypothetical protein
MKKLILTMLLALCFSFAQATIHNVDNSPNRPAGYIGNLQLAVNSASAGDTIYIYPSNQSYGSITIKQRLHLFGKAYDGTIGNVSRLDNLSLDTAVSPSTNPSGSSIQGLTVSYVTCQKPNICNIMLVGNMIRSYINLASNCSGWLIANNFVTGYLDLGYNSNILITNNIIDNSMGIYYSNSPSVVFSHNLILNFQFFYSCSNMIVTDNIFVCTANTNSQYMSNINFINNLSWRTTLTPYAMPPEGNYGTGNISNQDPQFMTALSSGAFDSSKDYHLKTTSPGKNAATDGTDMGPFGGTNPFVWGGYFSIPKISQSTITNPVINVNTPVNVNVKAVKAGI